MNVMMPRKGGLQAGRGLCMSGVSTALIPLTARSSETDKDLGLDLGADDYLAKSFGMLELMARVTAQLRSILKTSNANRSQAIDLAIDFNAYRDNRNDDPIELSAPEYRLLRYLISKQEIVVTRHELLDESWGYLLSNDSNLRHPHPSHSPENRVKHRRTAPYPHETQRRKQVSGVYK